MKKIYIAPSVMVVSLRPFSAILSTSSVGYDDSDANSLEQSEILTREQTYRSSNVWDDEW